MHQLSVQDWWWVIGFLAAAFALSAYHARKSSQSIEDYFVAGQHTAWWVLGTSIVATTFAADTPLAVSGLVIRRGVASNWFWWAVVPSGMLGVFFFARLWRRSGCLTQAEFARVRYGPGRADVLRLFYVFYHGVIYNAVTLGFVNLAMVKIITLCTTLNKWEALAICFVLTILYTALGGINGVMWTDFLQFALALATSIAIACYAVADVGGLETLRGAAGYLTPVESGSGSAAVQSAIKYFPEPGTTDWNKFLIYVGIYWIFCTPTDCNGYAVQRLLSARNERHAVWGYLWYNFAHYVLRPWPWVLVGLVAMVTLHGAGVRTTDAEGEYIRVLLQRTPPWLLGPAIASLLAAYMSTIDTHLNWGASYLINDFYRPYVRKGASARHYVMAGRLAIVVVALAGIGATGLMSSIVQGWGIVFGLLSGMGLVGILRWLWWRVTAWTELCCMAAAGVATAIMHFGFPGVTEPFFLLVTVPSAMLGAVVGTFCFKPEPRDVLLRFWSRVRPPGPGWRGAAKLDASAPACPSIQASPDRPAKAESAPFSSSNGGGLLRPLLCWIMASAAIYCALFGVGDLLLKSRARGAGLCLAAFTLALLVGWLHREDGAARRPPEQHAA